MSSPTPVQQYQGQLPEEQQAPAPPFVNRFGGYSSNAFVAELRYLNSGTPTRQADIQFSGNGTNIEMLLFTAGKPIVVVGLATFPLLYTDVYEADGTLASPRLFATQASAVRPYVATSLGNSTILAKSNIGRGGWITGATLTGAVPCGGYTSNFLVSDPFGAQTAWTAPDANPVELTDLSYAAVEVWSEAKQVHGPCNYDRGTASPSTTYLNQIPILLREQDYIQAHRDAGNVISIGNVLYPIMGLYRAIEVA